MAAKVDEAAAFLCQKKWGDLEFPPAFGRAPYPEEAYIKELDGKTGASLKLTILNRRGTQLANCVLCCHLCGADVIVMLSRVEMNRLIAFDHCIGFIYFTMSSHGILQRCSR